MIIADLIIPRDDICQENELYIKGMGYEVESNYICISSGGVLSTLTYFNSISIDKLLRYTTVSKLKLNIECSGSYVLKLFSAEVVDEKIKKTPIVDSMQQDSVAIVVDLTKYHGQLYWDLFAYTDVDLIKAYYSVDLEELRFVNIAIGVCTYKREMFIQSNLTRLLEFLSVCSELNNNVDIYISDNGQTLPLSWNDYDKINLVYNQNMGGAGGFTRCLLESLNSKKNYTNFIFMDDDIILDPYVILKVYRLIKILKEEYVDSVIGGAMFSIVDQYLQFENGASWRNNGFSFNNRNLDLRISKNVILNERNNDVNYNAWCFCCIPFKVVTSNNLPLPIFFHMDDVEYGLRNGLNVILLNGICVWHAYSRLIVNPKNDYYDIRNRLIMVSEICPNDVTKLLSTYLRSFTYEIAKYHYARTINAFAGILDYLKGFDYFKNLNTINKHEQLHNNVKWNPSKNWDQAHFSIKDTKLNADDLKKIMCCMIKSKETAHIFYDNSIADTIGCKSIVVYNPEEKLQIEYKRDYVLFLKCLLMRRKINSYLKRGINSIIDEYSNRINELQSFVFWSRYLNIDYEKKYNILMVASDNDLTSGAFRSMCTLCSILQKKYPVDMLVLLPKKGDGTNLLKSMNLRYTIIPSEDWIIKQSDNNTSIRNKKKCIKDLNRVAINKIKELIISEKINLVHLNTSYTYVGAEAARLTSTPYVWHIREFLEEDQKRRMINRKKGYALMSKSNRVIAISDSILNKYSTCLKTKNLIRIYNGVDIFQFYKERPIFQNKIVSILCVGAITEYKGQHLLLEAAIRLIKEGYAIEVTFAGNDVGAYANDMRLKINEEKMENQITLVGRNQDISKLYQESDISCTCSRSEAFGRTTVEAMLSGCLVIGADSAGTKEILCDDSGFLFEIDNASDLYVKLKFVLNNKKKSSAVALKGQIRAKNMFNADRNADEIYSVYNEIIGDKL